MKGSWLIVEFIPLRSLQRGLPEVWRTLRREKGRIVLTNKGQPAYLLVDLSGQNVVSLVNWVEKQSIENILCFCAKTAFQAVGIQAL